MTPAVVSKIFEPFFTTKPPGKGTGPGLSAVYDTVHEHCGTIAVYSEPGMGTAFKLYLPCLVEEKSVAVSDFLPPVYGTGTSLVIDDDAKIRANLGDMISALGYRVIEASGGRDGIEIYRTKQDEIDVVIIDMVMPEMTGYETIEVLGRLDSNVKIAVLKIIPELWGIFRSLPG
jgi:hypothetical protein